MVEEKIDKLEGIVREIMQNEHRKDKKMFFNEKDIQLCLKDNFRWPNICVVGVAEGKWGNKYICRTSAENLPNLMKTINS